MKKLKSSIIILLIISLSIFAFACDKIEPLATPSDVAVSGTVLNWQEVENASGYKVEINGNDVRLVSTNSFSLSALPVGEYSIKVQAYANGHLDSAWSTAATYSVQAVTATKLTAPTGVSESDKVVSWNAVSNASSYTVEINGVLYSVSATSTSFSLAEITAAGSYSIKVKAIGDGVDYANSDYSSAITYTIAAAVSFPFDAPENLAVAGKVLTWDAVDYADRYEVSVAGTLYQVEGTSFDVSSLNDIKSYELKVRALPSGDYTISNWSAPVIHKILGQLSAVEFIEGSGNIEWNHVSNAQKYIVTYDGNSVIQTETFINKVIATDTDVKVVAIADNYLNSPVAGIDMASKSFTFTVNKGEATITGITSFAQSSTKIAVPSIINGYKVVDFSRGALSAVSTTITDLTIPFLKSSNDAIGYLFNTTNSAVGANLVNITVAGDTEIVTNSLWQLGKVLKIEFLGSATSIGDLAFANCVLLNSIKLPSGVKTIGDNAFYNCLVLPTIELPASVEVLSTSVFNNCRELTTLNIPDSVTSIGNGAFTNCIKLTGEEYQNTIHLGKWALRAVNTNITSAGIKDGTVGILERCYASCAKLTTISIPDSVKFMSTEVFEGCTALTYQSYNGLSYLNNWVATSETSIAGAVIFKPGTVGIMANAFNGRIDIETVIIPNTVTYIGAYAFRACEKLATINIGNSVNFIGRNAFANTAIESIIVPDSVTSLSQELFANCSLLSDVSLPNTLKSIGESAFSGCVILAELRIPASVNSFGANVFANCLGLSKLIFEGTVPANIQSSSFYSGTYLYVPEAAIAAYKAKWQTVSNRVYSADDTSLDFILSADGTHLQRYLGSAATITIPDTVTTIDAYAFNGFRHVKKVTLGAKVTTIAARAFYNCAGLNEVDFTPATGNITIGESAFYSAGLTTLVLPENVKIGEDTFAYNRSLASVTLPKSLKDLPARVFSHAEVLTAIDLSNVETIGVLAFYRCFELKNVITSSKLKIVSKQAFLVCNKLQLEKVNGVNYLGNIAFSLDLAKPEDVEDLTEVNFRAGTTILYDYFLTPQYVRTDVVKDDDNKVVSSTDVFAFANKVATLDLTGFTSIGFQAAMLSGLTNITIPSTLQFMGAQAFDSCDKLTTVHYDASLSIPEFTFYGCTALATFEFGDNVSFEAIGKEAFKKCRITSFTLPEGVKSLSQGVFGECAELTSVDLANVETIMDGAFAGTAKLESIVLPATIKTLGNYVGNATDGYYYAQTLMFSGSGVKTIQIDTTAKIQPVAPQIRNSQGNIFTGALQLETIVLNYANHTFVANQFAVQTDETLNKLTTIVFGENFTTGTSSMTGLIRNSFVDSKVTTIYVRTLTPIVANAGGFTGIELTNIYVPASLVDTYKAAAGWKNFATVITALEE